MVIEEKRQQQEKQTEKTEKNMFSAYDLANRSYGTERFLISRKWRMRGAKKRYSVH